MIRCVKLDWRHRAAADVLAHGGTRKAAAKAAQVSIGTIGDWLRKYPEFEAFADERNGPGMPTGTIIRTIPSVHKMTTVTINGNYYRHREGDPREFCVWCATQRGARHIPGCRLAV